MQLSAADDSNELLRLADAFAKDIFEAQAMPDMLPDDLINAYAKRFLNAINSGFSTDANIVPGNQQQAILDSLRKNAYQFSAAKTYAQGKALTEAIINEAGQFRSWSDFKTEAYKVNNTHCDVWLKAEYNNGIVASQAAGQWATIQATKDTLPLLEFVAVIDSHTSDLCRKLHGTILPINHPFWKMYFIPNHYGERATINQLRSGTITPDADIPSAEIPAMFRTNIAEGGMMFPPEHPYFKDAPKGVIKQGTKAFKNAFKS